MFYTVHGLTQHINGFVSMFATASYLLSYHYKFHENFRYKIYFLCNEWMKKTSKVIPGVAWALARQADRPHAMGYACTKERLVVVV